MGGGGKKNKSYVQWATVELFWFAKRVEYESASRHTCSRGKSIRIGTRWSIKIYDVEASFFLFTCVGPLPHFHSSFYSRLSAQTFV